MNHLSTKKLNTGQVFSYGAGNLGLNLFFASISTYLLYFYTDNFGLTAVAAGNLMFLVQLINLVINPLMGVLIDRTNSRWGKFRPYILFGCIPLAVIGILTFTVPPLDASGKLVYAYITYILFNITYAIVNVPYSSLLADMSNDYHMRSRISSIKVSLGQAGGLIVSVATLPLVHLFANEANGFQVIYSIFGLILILTLMTTFFGTKGLGQTASDNKAQTGYAKKPNNLPITSTLKALIKNKYLLLLLVYIVVNMVSLATKNAVAVYFFKYNVGQPNLFSLYSLVGFGILILFVLLNPIFVKKIGKRNVGILSQSIVIVALGGFYLFHDSLIGVFVFGGLSYVGFGLATPLLWSMLPDTIEYGEWKTGIRSEGTIYAAFIFAQLFAQAIGAKVSGAILGAIGYVPNAVQTPTALHGIVMMQTVIPIVGAVIGILILMFYKLDHQTFSRIVEEIKERNEKKADEIQVS